MGMRQPAFGWLNRPGLAGGIDKTGERADELLGLGFGSVEFGSVTRQPLPGSNPGLEALILAIATVSRKKRPKTAIGIGLGLPPDLPAEGLADEWLQGLGLLAELPLVPDYLSLNLSAAANRRFVGPDLRPVLLDALAQVAHWRHRQTTADRPQLAVKLPLEAAIGLIPAIRQAGVGQMTVVISDGQARPVALVMLRQLCAAAQGVRIVAVGGIRNATERLKMLNAGCAGVQVHRLFVAEGAATPGLLLTC